jgi:hypothetical protein
MTRNVEALGRCRYSCGTWPRRVDPVTDGFQSQLTTVAVSEVKQKRAGNNKYDELKESLVEISYPFGFPPHRHGHVGGHNLIDGASSFPNLSQHSRAMVRG